MSTTELSKLENEKLVEIPKPQALLDTYIKTVDDIKVGDYYLSDGYSYQIINVTAIERLDNGVDVIKYQDVADYKFDDESGALILYMDEDWKHSMPSDEFTEKFETRRISYKEISKYLKDCDDVFNGKEPSTDSDKSSKDGEFDSTAYEDEMTTALSTYHSQSEMIAQSSNIYFEEDKANKIMLVSRAMADMVKARMDRQIMKVKKELAVVKEKINTLRKVITMLNLYSGKEVNIEVLREGAIADSSEKIHLYQDILFMDEECAIYEDGGIDINHIDKFVDWLLSSEDNINVFIPHQKGLVAMKPRRFKKDYGDSLYNNQMEMWNRHTFFLFRNGENLYLVDSDDIEVYDTLFPLRGSIEKLYKEYNESLEKYGSDSITTSEFERKLKKFNERYYFFLMFFQGILDNSNVFEGTEPFRLTNPSDCAKWLEHVYDAEPSLSDGHKTFNEWKDVINSRIKRGTRILYVMDNWKWNYTATDFVSRHFLRYYANEWSAPNFPSNGVYTLDTFKTASRYGDGNYLSSEWIRSFDDNKPLAFKYKSGGDYWKKEQTVTCVVNKYDDFLNYDELTLEDVEFYIKDRVSRKNYLSIMPHLVSAYHALKKEQAKEDAFVMLMKGELLKIGVDVDKATEIIREGIEWWKNKVICHRPIDSDDAKAVRMIKNYVRKRIN